MEIKEGEANVCQIATGEDVQPCSLRGFATSRDGSRRLKLPTLLCNWIFKGELRSLGEVIQTQTINIYNINEVIIQNIFFFP